ncbi:MAG: diphosphate--fructose-6-phosphate 1-phosphotransferase, partial [Gammaproteobacteria bacterium]
IIFSTLATLANVEKMMPRSYITKDGLGITNRCRTYLAPLIKGEAYPPYKEGLPKYIQLKNIQVPKILNTDFKI